MNSLSGWAVRVPCISLPFMLPHAGMTVLVAGHDVDAVSKSSECGQAPSAARSDWNPLGLHSPTASLCAGLCTDTPTRYRLVFLPLSRCALWTSAFVLEIYTNNDLIPVYTRLSKDGAVTSVNSLRSLCCLALTEVLLFRPCSIPVYGGYAEADQLYVSLHVSYGGQSSSDSRAVNASELERLKKRFMKLDTYGPLLVM